MKPRRVIFNAMTTSHRISLPRTRVVGALLPQVSRKPADRRLHGLPWSPWRGYSRTVPDVLNEARNCLDVTLKFCGPWLRSNRAVVPLMLYRFEGCSLDLTRGCLQLPVARSNCGPNASTSCGTCWRTATD